MGIPYGLGRTTEEGLRRMSKATRRAEDGAGEGKAASHGGSEEEAEERRGTTKGAWGWRTTTLENRFSVGLVVREGCWSAQEFARV